MYLIIAFHTPPNTIYTPRKYQNNSLDVYACQMQIKAALEVEFQICKKKIPTEHTFEYLPFLYMNIYYNVYY